MKIQLVTPAPLRIDNGNKITAMRWAALLRRLGHQVRIGQSYDGKSADLLIALHARRSFPSIRRFHELHPDLPLILVLTGTDLYRDIVTDRNAQRSLEMAHRIVVLQSMALAELPRRLHAKTRVIYQSAEPCKARRARARESFRVCLIGHLRAEKDPLRAALAARQLPPTSRIEIVHVGLALDRRLGARARAEAAENPRYRWIGALPHRKTRRLLAESDLAVITSHMEGSSNVLSEALASSVPVIASRIPGLIGTLGKIYPGYFPPGNSRRLAALLRKVESDRGFYMDLKRRCARLAALVSPARELKNLKGLLSEFA